MGTESLPDTRELERISTAKSAEAADRHLKLDPHGYPLRPQPLGDPLGKYYASRS